MEAMTPKSFDIIDGITKFRYSTRELIEWTKLGREHGDVGMILLSRKGNFLTYGGYGTIENPCKFIQYLTLNHFPPFDGEMVSDGERIMPVMYSNKGTTSSHSFMMINLAKKI
jgi:hypothetical protein